MSQPAIIEQVPGTGGPIYIEDDVTQLRHRFEPLPLDSPRRLANASVENGIITAFFETEIEPSVEECR